MLLIGCQTSQTICTEADLFLIKHPSLKTNYTHLDPMALRQMKFNSDAEYSLETKLIEIATRSSETNGATSKQLQAMTQVRDGRRQSEIEVIEGLEKLLKESNGQIYYYEFSQDSEGEEGYMVIYRGKIQGKVHVFSGKVFN